MASIEYDGFTEYSARDAATLNTILAAFQDRSSTIEAAMMRDEGLGPRIIADGAVVDDGDDDSREWVGAPEGFASIVFTVISFSTVTMRVDNGGAGWTLEDGESLRLRFHSTFALDNDPIGSARVSFIVAKTVGGVTSTETYSRQNFVGRRHVFPVNPGTTMAGVCEVDEHRGDVYIPWLFQGPVVLDSVEIQLLVTVGAVFLGRTGLQVVPFYR